MILAGLLLAPGCLSPAGGVESTRAPEVALEQALNAGSAVAVHDHLRLTHPPDLELMQNVWAAGGGRWAVEDYDTTSDFAFEATLSNGLASYRLSVTGLPGSSAARVAVYKTSDRRFAPIETLSAWEVEANQQSFGVTAHTFDLSDQGCSTRHAFGGDPGDPVPLASVSKLLIGAVAASDGPSDMADRLTIDDAVRSLPSGTWHQLPNGTSRTVAEAIAAMWSDSDNTAADMLVRHIGADQIQQTSTASFGYEPDLPFLTTAELFKLKWGGDPEAARIFSEAATLTERQRLLGEVSEEPLPLLTGSELPTYNETVEWRASPAGVCEALRTIWADSTFRPIAEHALAVGQGTPLDPSWFVKYGSEPGVFTAAGISRIDSATPVVIVFAAIDANSLINLVDVQRLFENYSRLTLEKSA